MKSAIEDVRIMIKTGASEKTVRDYVISLLIKGKITSRCFELLTGMIADNY